MTTITALTVTRFLMLVAGALITAVAALMWIVWDLLSDMDEMRGRMGGTPSGENEGGPTQQLDRSRSGS